jgi:hypothetical protein
MNNLGMLPKAQGKLAEAELLFLEVLRVQSLTLGEKHPDTLTSMVSWREVTLMASSQSLP